jgi:hypothetical protein
MTTSCSLPPLPGYATFPLLVSTVATASPNSVGAAAVFDGSWTKTISGGPHLHFEQGHFS